MKTIKQPHEHAGTAASCNISPRTESVPGPVFNFLGVLMALFYIVCSGVIPRTSGARDLTAQDVRQGHAGCPVSKAGNAMRGALNPERRLVRNVMQHNLPVGLHFVGSLLCVLIHCRLDDDDG
jgi:hypothetical protein